MLGTPVGVPFCATEGCEAELLLAWAGELFVFEALPLSPLLEHADNIIASKISNKYRLKIESFIAE